MPRICAQIKRWKPTSNICADILLSAHTTKRGNIGKRNRWNHGCRISRSLCPRWSAPRVCELIGADRIGHARGNGGASTEWTGEICRTKLCVYEWLIVIDSETLCSRNVLSKAWGQIGVQLTAVVIHSPSRSNHQLAVEHLRTPGDAKPGRKSPLPPSQSGVAHALCPKFRIVPSDNQTIRGENV